MSKLYIYIYSWHGMWKKWKTNIFPNVEKQLSSLKEKLKANTIYI